jgi:hypothetical protein
MDADADVILRWSLDGRAESKRTGKKGRRFPVRLMRSAYQDGPDHPPLPLRDRLARLLNSILLE